MERTLIGELNKHIGKEVKISGWVDVARNQGKMAFFDFRDRSGKVQGVVFGKPEVLETTQTLKQEWVVSISGIVNQRPEKMVRADVQNGDIELEITAITILAEAESLPFDMDADLNLDTMLDYRPLTLRRARDRAIFTIQATILDEYRKSLVAKAFTEFRAPALVGGDAEGGAAVFNVEYFKDQRAFLATSPQLYKQIMVGALERVFTIANIFRAEKSATTRHLSEITQMDFEMGFIKDETDVMEVLEDVIRATVQAVTTKHATLFAELNVPLPLADAAFPRMTLTEAIAMFDKANNVDSEDKSDLTPEQERWLCDYVQEKYQSDFLFITRFPTTARAFYTYEAAPEAPYSRGFDLLFRGLEINSGAQRIHSYDEMVARITERGLDPKKFGFYLQAFKYGMPPHGGCSTGLERFTARMLNLDNVKEAVPFPRDMNRIDTLLSQGEEAHE